MVDKDGFMRVMIWTDNMGLVTGKVMCIHINAHIETHNYVEVHGAHIGIEPNVHLNSPKNPLTIFSNKITMCCEAD